MEKLKKLLMSSLGLALVLAFTFNVSANAQSSNYERVTWDQLKSESFDVNSITKEDVEKANEVAGESLDSLFKEDKDGYATMDISAIEKKYGTGVANVFKLGLANINLDIQRGATQFAPDHKSFIKGPNYDKYATNDSQGGKFAPRSCSAKGGSKAIVSGAIGGAVTGAVGGEGVGAVPGGLIGGAAGGLGYYATCWW
ncbi:hypothetical protein [Scopulibacillus cellulosilyticus]|uniref:Uncharacterized protein n=1 Tax=Scopulibacillus cellulosilyticus TaxID=2665665 RepID=A0ABW2Q033_9BACL